MGTNIATTSESFNKASDKSWLGTRAGLQDMRSITLDISEFDPIHIANGYLPSGMALGRITSSGLYAPYDVTQDASTPFTAQTINEVQSLVATGGSSGDFTLTFDGATTAAIVYNAIASAVQSALEALPNINVGDVVCTGGPLPATPVVITFGGQYADRDVPALVVVDNVTGGNATITTTEGGAGGNGQEVFAGLLFEECKVTALTDANVGAALYWTGVVKANKLPSFTQDTSVDEAGAGEINFTDLANRLGLVVSNGVLDTGRIRFEGIA